MAKYSDIKGFTVQTLSTDTIASQAAGGSWSSGGDLNTPRGYVAGGAVGTRDSMIAAGGYTTTSVAVSEQYNGTSWTETNDLNTGRYDLQRFGTATAAFHCGGEGVPSPPNTTKFVESWNGSSWTETTDMPADKRNGGGAGTTTAGLVYGGNNAPPGTKVVEGYEWNGSSWTDAGDMNTARRYFASYGTQTAAHAVGGRDNSSNRRNIVEEYNGSAWTEIADINTTRDAISGAGIYTDSLVYGGDAPPTTGKTEFWNGSSWTEISDMATARQYFGSAGTNSSAALAFANVGISAATEEWDAPATFNQQVEGQLFFNSTANAFKETISDVPGATWASMTASSTPRFGAGGAGTQTEALIFSGAGGSPTVNRPQTEFWNGSSWTELNDMNQGRYLSAKTSFGTVYTAALAATGYTYTSPAQNIANVETWDGTSWTEVNDVNSARRGAGAGGTSTSGIIGGGYTTSITDLAETWNGSSWTEVSELNTGREDTGGVGTSNSDMQMHGGYLGSPGQSGATEQWNGSSWTEVNDMNTARSGAAGSGIPSLAIAVGGEPGPTAKTEFWNGTTWTEVADLGTARTKASSSATSALASILVSGSVPPFTAVAEEWTVNLANKTITAS